MKNTTQLNLLVDSCDLNELSVDQQISLTGGNLFYDAGYAIGLAGGYFFAVGDRLILEVIAFVRFGFLR